MFAGPLHEILSVEGQLYDPQAEFWFVLGGMLLREIVITEYSTARGEFQISSPPAIAVFGTGISEDFTVTIPLRYVAAVVAGGASSIKVNLTTIKPGF